jgi:hypothetical protein
MGATFSPYQTGQGTGHAKEMILGDPKDTENMYHWAMARLNLPGLELYDPRKAWVAKVRPDGRVAADVFVYMNDFCPTGPDKEACWQANSKAGRTCNHLGIKYAPRKRRGSSRTPGPWAVSMIYTDDPEEGGRVLISQKKWYKAKRLLQSLRTKLDESLWVDHKELEKTGVFIIYVLRTYPPMTPFLKSLRLPIDAWRPERYEES